MARLRDIKVGMKVQIVRGKEDPEDFSLTLSDWPIGMTGEVCDIDNNDKECQVQVEIKGLSDWYYPASWIKIIKDEGETKMTTAQPQKYVLMDEEDISKPFTDISSKGILGTSYEEWCWDIIDTTERIKEGKMKLFKIEEVKLEVTEPSIKIVG